VSRIPSAGRATPSAVRDDVRRLLLERPELERLTLPQASEPDSVAVRVLRPGPAPLVLIPIPIPHLPGHAFASRLPGMHAPAVEEDLDALVTFGIERIFCLVPPQDLDVKHRVARYRSLAKARFGERFHVVSIADHDIPDDDEELVRSINSAHRALSRSEHVLVHCVGGCGRTGVFLACLMTECGLSPEAAIVEFRKARRCGPETPEQVAYVVRHAAKRRSSASRVTLTRRANGETIELARGGLARILLGRLHPANGRTKRVAVKLFSRPLTDADAEALTRCIHDLRAAGVHLPKMGVVRLDDGTWVQVAQLFGARDRGSKLHQPGTFYRELGRDDRHFAADQLARVTRAGYLPSIDLFLVFRTSSGLFPVDLDLIVPEKSARIRAERLITRLIQISTDRTDRDGLFEVAIAAASPEVATEMETLVTSDTPYRRIWRGL
jgi:protein-tyrosine phosphatase